MSPISSFLLRLTRPPRSFDDDDDDDDDDQILSPEAYKATQVG